MIGGIANEIKGEELEKARRPFRQGCKPTPVKERKGRRVAYEETPAMVQW